MFDLQSVYWVLFDVDTGKSARYQAAAASAAGMPELMDRFDNLLEPGTAHGEAPGSRARPETWTDPEGFATAAQAFRDQASATAQAAVKSDLESFATEFDLLASACAGRHGLRPSSEGPYRSAVGQ